jgi:phosphatidylserine/phosphatidylglycerophosphate/cardiolipin synthase-like enzyme
MRPPRVKLVVGDAFRVFARAAVAAKPRRIYLVSPWVDESVDGLAEVLGAARRAGSRVLLVTRTPASRAHAAAVAKVASLPRGEVAINARVHAKTYMFESEWGSCVAVVGSANLTHSPKSSSEIGLVVVGRQHDRIMRDLARVIFKIARDGSKFPAHTSSGEGHEGGNDAYIA